MQAAWPAAVTLQWTSFSLSCCRSRARWALCLLLILRLMVRCSPGSKSLASGSPCSYQRLQPAVCKLDTGSLSLSLSLSLCPYRVQNGTSKSAPDLEASAPVSAQVHDRSASCMQTGALGSGELCEGGPSALLALSASSQGPGITNTLRR